MRNNTTISLICHRNQTQTVTIRAAIMPGMSHGRREDGDGEGRVVVDIVMELTACCGLIGPIMSRFGKLLFYILHFDIAVSQTDPDDTGQFKDDFTSQLRLTIQQRR